MDELIARMRQGHRTVPYSSDTVKLPDRYRGCPELDVGRCRMGCEACAKNCPTDAVSNMGTTVTIDLGKCLFCGACEKACPEGAIRFSRRHALATRTRQDLLMSDSALQLAERLDRKARSLFGRSLRLRQVSAGGCNACEADTNVLNTLVFDLGRYGIQFVASPRHADGVLVTGPVTINMRQALLKTYEAIPDPKLVVAVGACAISGGPYSGLPDVCNGVEGLLPIDLYIPGCPPHPWTILDGLLRLLGRVG